MKKNTRRTKAASNAVTIKHVAKHAGVSVATVSRVLNEHKQVDPELRRRVQEAVRELGFVRNVIASSLVRQRPESVGLIVPHMVAFYVPLINEIERVVHEHGKSLIIATRLYEDDQVVNAVDFLRQRRCGSIILHPGSTGDEEILALLEQEPTLVLVYRWYEKFRQRCVIVDNRLGAQMATRYLIDCGHREIALITGPQQYPECRERTASFMQTMQEAQLTVPPALVVEGEDFRAPSGERCMAKLLQTGKRFSAVFCLSDELAAGAIRYMRSIGKQLPQDLSIVGFDDIVYAEHLHPRLTTVRQPLDVMGRMAAERAIALDRGIELPDEPTILPPELKVRDSVVPAGSTSPAIRETRWNASVSG